MTADPHIPETAPFDPLQRLWLNGYLAGLLAGKGYVPAGATGNGKPASGKPLAVLYGSQTGTAERLAKQFAKDSKGRGRQARVVEAAAHATIDWSREADLVVITSTYGDGDMPDNAQAFWDWLQTDAAASLAHLRFSVLALGDTNYEHFCAAGKKIDARLETLGARRVHPLVECDLDYESKAKAWMDRLLQRLEEGAGTNGSSPGASHGNGTHTETRPERESNGATPTLAFGKANPFPARLLKNVLLNKAGSDKEVRHYEISLAGSGLAYEAGDALGVLPENCPDLVNELLAALGCDGEEKVSVGESAKRLREALAKDYDVCKPSPELLAAVAQASPDSALAPLVAPERREDLKKWLWGRDVTDVLRLAPSPFPIARLLPMLRRLAPRLYSISSSPKAHPGEVHLTVGAVRYQSHGRLRKGVASTFLADRAGESGAVKVFVQPSHGFKPPASGDTPMIMVGPGTGIAPFRAFLEERLANGAKGRNWLFFGDQKRSADFLYEEQIAAWQRSGLLTRLDLAFSRDQAEKVYVQHRMLENAAELWSWLQAGAHFYVCGDASRMAKDVDAALHKIAETAGGLSSDAAAEFVKGMKADKRYQRDVY
ncbi:MAG: sulfite reductase subunit alpha [Verrucomicrobia bacterium]|nr:sulfite reductase subunit alpha [Verrucomicrobiota bacterium]